MSQLWRSFLLLLCLAAGLGFYLPLANADEIVELYKIDTLVTSQDAAEREQATTDGLAEVLVRSSGSTAVLQNPNIVAALRRASNYLLEISYTDAEALVEVDGQEKPARGLSLLFSGPVIQQLLRDSGATIWPANRPNTLVWLVVDDGRAPRLLNPAEAEGYYPVARKVAKQRGLPLLQPLMDLEDQVALSAQDLWRMNEGQITRASQRYDADGVLVGRLTRTSRGQWRASWQLLHRGKSVAFDGISFQLEDVVAKALNDTVDYYVSLYGVSTQPGQAEALTLQVANVNDYQAYMSLIKYLESLVFVRTVDVAAVRGSDVLLYVTLDGDMTLLKDALSLEQRLLLQADLSGSTYRPGSAENPLRYGWQ